MTPFDLSLPLFFLFFTWFGLVFLSCLFSSLPRFPFSPLSSVFCFHNS